MPRIFLPTAFKPFIHLHHLNNDFNYLCDDNIINKDFLTWYLSKFYQKSLPINYKISIIDDDCEMFDLEQDKTIEFHSDGYKIV